MYSDLRGDQARQTIDVEQVFAAYLAARQEARHLFAGSMAWKRVGRHSYLYRKRGTAWRSLGARSPQTEMTERSFREGGRRRASVSRTSPSASMLSAAPAALRGLADDLPTPSTTARSTEGPTEPDW